MKLLIVICIAITGWSIKTEAANETKFNDTLSFLQKKIDSVSTDLKMYKTNSTTNLNTTLNQTMKYQMKMIDQLINSSLYNSTMMSTNTTAVVEKFNNCYKNMTEKTAIYKLASTVVMQSCIDFLMNDFANMEQNIESHLTKYKKYIDDKLDGILILCKNKDTNKQSSCIAKQVSSIIQSVSDYYIRTLVFIAKLDTFVFAAPYKMTKCFTGTINSFKKIMNPKLTPAGSNDAIKNST